jgi:hypothetical protein
MVKIAFSVNRGIERQVACMVLESQNRLQAQPVVALDVHLHHIDIHSELASSSFKVKFRIGDSTHLKSAAAVPAQSTDGTLRVTCDTHGSCIFEGEDSLHFELCKQSLFGASQTVARGEIPVWKVLRPEENERADTNVLKIELFSVHSPGTVLGDLAVQLGCQKKTFEDAGGMKLLRFRVSTVCTLTGQKKSVALADAPQITKDMQFASPADGTNALKFVEDAEKATAHLRQAFDIAMTAVAHNSRSRGRCLSTRTNSTTFGSDLISEVSVESFLNPRSVSTRSHKTNKSVTTIDL